MFRSKRIRELESENALLQCQVSILEKREKLIPRCECQMCKHVFLPDYKVQGVNQFKNLNQIVLVCPNCGSSNLTTTDKELTILR